MSGLAFIYGTVSSGKTLRLLSHVYQYRKLQNESICVMNPSLDTRKGLGVISSRMANIEEKADLVIHPDDSVVCVLEQHPEFDKARILVDEVQFLQPHHIQELYELSLTRKVGMLWITNRF